VSGGEGGFNPAQPPEVRQHVGREIDERGNGPIACVLPGPAQDLPHLPALPATRHVHQPAVNRQAGCQTVPVTLV
jgi:hypothetical protein